MAASIVRENAFEIFGGPQALVGPELKPGDKAPDFTVVDMNFKPVRLADFKGKVAVLASVPSLDTSVCNREANRFGEEALKLSDDIQIVTVSMDLPFALKRWCQANNSERLIAASDHRDASFGEGYGVLLRDYRLLSRAVFVVDRGGTLRYVEYVPVAGQEPNYEAVLNAAREAAKA